MSSSQTPARTATIPLVAQAITIMALDNVTRVSLYVVAGPVTLKGNFPFANTGAGTPIASTPITMTTGTTWVKSSQGPEAPIDGLTIDATGGSCNVVMEM